MRFEEANAAPLPMPDDPSISEQGRIASERAAAALIDNGEVSQSPENTVTSGFDGVTKDGKDPFPNNALEGETDVQGAPGGDTTVKADKKSDK